MQPACPRLHRIALRPQSKFEVLGAKTDGARVNHGKITPSEIFRGGPAEARSEASGSRYSSEKQQRAHLRPPQA